MSGEHDDLEKSSLLSHRRPRVAESTRSKPTCLRTSARRSSAGRSCAVRPAGHRAGGSRLELAELKFPTPTPTTKVAAKPTRRRRPPSGWGSAATSSTRRCARGACGASTSAAPRRFRRPSWTASAGRTNDGAARVAPVGSGAGAFGCPAFSFLPAPA